MAQGNAFLNKMGGKSMAANIQRVGALSVYPTGSDTITPEQYGDAIFVAVSTSFDPTSIDNLRLISRDIDASNFLLVYEIIDRTASFSITYGASSRHAGAYFSI